jgi:hypothetical protein
VPVEAGERIALDYWNAEGRHFELTSREDSAPAAGVVVFFFSSPETGSSSLIIAEECHFYLSDVRRKVKK